MEVEISFETSVHFYQTFTLCMPEIIFLAIAVFIRNVNFVVFFDKGAIATIPLTCWRYSVGRY